MLHLPFSPERFRWEGVEERDYKESEGERRGMGWRGLTRHTLVPGGSVAAGFEQRYFEIEPGGYSSLEKHEHVHVVVTLRGAAACSSATASSSSATWRCWRYRPRRRTAG